MSMEPERDLLELSIDKICEAYEGLEYHSDNDKIHTKVLDHLDLAMTEIRMAIDMVEEAIEHEYMCELPPDYTLDSRFEWIRKDGAL